MEDRPVLKCYPTDDLIHAKAWCPFCQEWHHHGLTGDIVAGRKSHRLSHCTNHDSPFFLSSGYYLKLMTQSELKEIAKAVDTVKKAKKDPRVMAR